jgi:hypothetical protein
MNLRKPLAIGAVATALVAGSALPASAAETDTTFELTAGALSISQAPSADLGADPSGTTTVSGSLGPVSVTDARGGTASWNVSGSSTAFTGALGSSSTAVQYTGGLVNTTGVSVVPAGVPTTLTEEPAVVVGPAVVSGNNTASYAPTLAVTMPASALADDYSGTVTTSVA